MLAKRIIPCLDVKDGQVVKGVRFRDHKVVGGIEALASYYSLSGADELVFYDITASSDQRLVDANWISKVARNINIPFCVAGGIRTLEQAAAILGAGADKISINSPAVENPCLIDQMVKEFGQQCIVIGVDSIHQDGGYWVYQYTGDVSKTKATGLATQRWIKEVQQRGAGEIVLNCMNQDGVRQGFDIVQLQQMRAISTVPLIASGGAGQLKDFVEVFREAGASGALAASVFHSREMSIESVKRYCQQNRIEVRL